MANKDPGIISTNPGYENSLGNTIIFLLKTKYFICNQIFNDIRERWEYPVHRRSIPATIIKKP